MLVQFAPWRTHDVESPRRGRAARRRKRRHYEDGNEHEQDEQDERDSSSSSAGPLVALSLCCDDRGGVASSPPSASLHHPLVCLTTSHSVSLLGGGGRHGGHDHPPQPPKLYTDESRCHSVRPGREHSFLSPCSSEQGRNIPASYDPSSDLMVALQNGRRRVRVWEASSTSSSSSGEEVERDDDGGEKGLPSPAGVVQIDLPRPAVSCEIISVVRGGIGHRKNQRRVHHGGGGPVGGDGEEVEVLLTVVGALSDMSLYCIHVTSSSNNTEENVVESSSRRQGKEKDRKRGQVVATRPRVLEAGLTVIPAPPDSSGRTRKTTTVGKGGGGVTTAAMGRRHMCTTVLTPQAADAEPTVLVAAMENRGRRKPSSGVVDGPPARDEEEILRVLRYRVPSPSSSDDDAGRDADVVRSSSSSIVEEAEKALHISSSDLMMRVEPPPGGGRCDDVDVEVVSVHAMLPASDDSDGGTATETNLAILTRQRRGDGYLRGGGDCCRYHYHCHVVSATDGSIVQDPFPVASVDGGGDTSSPLAADAVGGGGGTRDATGRPDPIEPNSGRKKKNNREIEKQNDRVIEKKSKEESDGDDDDHDDENGRGKRKHKRKHHKHQKKHQQEKDEEDDDEEKKEDRGARPKRETKDRDVGRINRRAGDDNDDDADCKSEACVGMAGASLVVSSVSIAPLSSNHLAVLLGEQDGTGVRQGRSGCRRRWRMEVVDVRYGGGVAVLAIPDLLSDDVFSSSSHRAPPSGSDGFGAGGAVVESIRLGASDPRTGEVVLVGYSTCPSPGGGGDDAATVRLAHSRLLLPIGDTRTISSSYGGSCSLAAALASHLEVRRLRRGDRLDGIITSEDPGSPSPSTAPPRPQCEERDLISALFPSASRGGEDDNGEGEESSVAVAAAKSLEERAMRHATAMIRCAEAARRQSFEDENRKSEEEESRGEDLEGIFDAAVLDMVGPAAAGRKKEKGREQRNQPQEKAAPSRKVHGDRFGGKKKRREEEEEEKNGIVSGAAATSSTQMNGGVGGVARPHDAGDDGEEDFSYEDLIREGGNRRKKILVRLAENDVNNGADEGADWSSLPGALLLPPFLHGGEGAGDQAGLMRRRYLTALGSLPPRFLTDSCRAALTILVIPPRPQRYRHRREGRARAAGRRTVEDAASNVLSKCVASGIVTMGCLNELVREVAAVSSMPPWRRNLYSPSPSSFVDLLRRTPTAASLRCYMSILDHCVDVTEHDLVAVLRHSCCVVTSRELVEFYAPGPLSAEEESSPVSGRGRGRGRSSSILPKLIRIADRCAAATTTSTSPSSTAAAEDMSKLASLSNLFWAGRVTLYSSCNEAMLRNALVEGLDGGDRCEARVLLATLALLLRESMTHHRHHLSRKEGESKVAATAAMVPSVVRWMTTLLDAMRVSSVTRREGGAAALLGVGADADADGGAELGVFDPVRDVVRRALSAIEETRDLLSLIDTYFAPRGGSRGRNDPVLTNIPSARHLGPHDTHVNKSSKRMRMLDNAATIPSYSVERLRF